MNRLPLAPTAILLALTSLSPALVPGMGEAQAQQAADREKKEEGRKVLKASDMDTATRSEAYRQAAREKRHQSMAFLKDILTNRPPAGAQKAEMMLRLAELYFEEGRDIYLDEMSAYQQKQDQCFNTKGCDPDKIQADNVKSRDWANKAIALYRQILQTYPQYQRADEATFFLANALADIGKRDEAVQEYTTLTKTYPQSPYIPDAYVQIGEYFFDNNNAYKALLAYQKATQFQDSPQYSFALYKLAWCYYNVGEHAKAIDTMKQVVAYSMTAEQAGAAEADQAKKKKLTLLDEALKDLVRFFADAGEIDEAYEYFIKLGKKDLIRDMLKRLAATYFEQGKFDQCINTYRRLIAENPQSPDAPEYQNEIIGAYTKMGNKTQTLTEINNLIKSYGKDSAWARANSANTEAIKEATDYVEKNLRTVATNYHNEAKKLGTGPAATEAYALAYKAYQVYLEQFPTGKYTYDVRYAFGELLYKIKKHDEAYVQYMKVVETDPKGQHSRFCAESAIFAAEEVIKKNKSTAKPPANKTESVPLTEWESNLIKACDQFSKLFPDDKATRNVIYKSAYILYDHNQFKEASDRFRVVIGMDPKSREAEQAANLILDSFNLVEDWQNLKDVSKAFYDQQGLGSAAFKTEVYNIYERASFKLIEVNFAKSKDEKAAADGYVAFYKEFPKSEVADLALNNAAVYYHNKGQIRQSMDARITLIGEFPKSKFYKEQVAALAFDYENIADFAKAAEWYEKLFSLDSQHASAKEALFSAAYFRKSMGDWKGAINNYNQFIKTYAADERVPNLSIEIAKIYEENKQGDAAMGAYQTFFTKPPTGANLDQVFFARMHYGLLLEGSNQQAKADKHWKETIAAYQAAAAKGEPMTAAVEFIAQIMFKQAKPQLDAYMAMKISGPPNKSNRSAVDKALLQQLKEKAQALQGVEKTYADIVKTGAGEWGLASLVVLGKAYENMAETLRTSYVPDYLTADQKELYTMGLEDKAYLQVEKATNTYSEALKKSFELNLYNELRPEDYPALVEELPTPRYTARSTSTLNYADKP
jgi:cellulose synthase operon protein C